MIYILLETAALGKILHIFAPFLETLQIKEISKREIKKLRRKP